MKVILTQDVEKLGTTHEVVEVADGYARNYLVPRGMAISANKSAMANLDNLKNGQMVRVEGTVLPSDDLAGGARYQVNRVQVIELDVK